MPATKRNTSLRTRLGVIAVALTLAASGCGGDEGGGADSVTLLAHSSFAISEATLEAFTAETGIGVEILDGGDAGAMLAQAILTKDNPIADVIFGVDNTFLSRAVSEEITVPYESSLLDELHPFTRLDTTNHFTPVDYGDVCLQYDKAALSDIDPAELFFDPSYGAELVVEDPSTSSPGLAFLLATIAAFPDGWQDWWTTQRNAGVLVVSGWEEAYYGEFSGASTGDRAVVVSYGSSPAAEVVFATEPIDEPATGIVVDSCFRQVEFAGVLAGTDAPEQARQLVDFMLSRRFQEDIPLNMFVFPARADATIPAVFSDHAVVADDPLTLDPGLIDANRDNWIAEWTDIVLR